MKSYGNSARQNLLAEVRSLGFQGLDTQAKTKELITINKFHAELKDNPKEAFDRLKRQIIYCIPRSALDLSNGIEKCLNEIENNDISSLIPPMSDNLAQWRYRHALLTGMLWHWHESNNQHNQSTDKTILSFDRIITNVLAENHLAQDDELVSFDDNSESENRTYLSLYQEAIEKEILTLDTGATEYNKRIEEKRIEEEKQKQEQAIRDQALIAITEEDKKIKMQDKKLYEEALAILNEELEKLGNLRDAIAIDGSPNTTIMDTCTYSNKLLATLNAETDKTMSYQNSSKLLEEMTKMISHLRGAYAPDITDEVRMSHIQAVNKHAVNFSQLSENTIKNEYEELALKILFVLSAILLAASIAALVAASSGSFLGLATFATTKTLITAKGVSLTVISDASFGCMFGGVLGIAFGGGALAIGEVGFFPPIKPVQEKAEIVAQAAKQSVENVVPLKTEIALDDAPTAPTLK